jgi:hypothetical protein
MYIAPFYDINSEEWGLNKLEAYLIRYNETCHFWQLDYIHVATDERIYQFFL